jgi:hypothetical protein
MLHQQEGQDMSESTALGVGSTMSIERLQGAHLKVLAASLYL